MVEFNDTRDAAKAIRMLNDTELDGRTIGVREYTEDGGEREQRGGGRREVREHHPFPPPRAAHPQALPLPPTERL
jgi:RNA recognition motif-containing protein